MGGKNKSSGDKRLCAVERRLASLALVIERGRFLEYAELASNDRRLFKKAFLAGLARGLGMAVGFTVLGAAAMHLLRLIARSRLPYIAEFIAKIVDMIENN